MKVQVVKVGSINSFAGDRYYDVLFYCYDDGRYRRCCVYPKFRNYKNWKNIDLAGSVYSGARIKRVEDVEFIDADSLVTYEGNHPLPSIKKNSNQTSLFN